MDVHLYLHVEDSPTVIKRLDLILARLGTLLSQEQRLMSTVQDVQQLVTDLKDETDKVAARLDAQAAAIQALKDQIAAGTPVSQEQLDRLVDGLAPISARLKALGSDPANPIPVDPQAPPAEAPPVDPAAAGAGTVTGGPADPTGN